MNPVEIRERERAESWLAAGLCLMRVGALAEESGPGITPWLEGVLSEEGALPPAGVIADIGHLITGGSMRELAPLPTLDTRLAQAIHAYEDHVLGRLDADPRLDAVIDALARQPRERRDRGVALFAGHLCKRLGFESAVALSPGVIRRVMERPALEISGRGYEALAARDDVERLLIAAYRDLTSNARRRGSLIGEAEVFLMENLDVLGDLTQRVAIEQIMEVTDALSAAIPRRLKPSAQAERARVSTELAATDNYPTGGFSALSTSGSLENLVSSELIYMEDGDPSDIDIFDVRYAEGELLYYTRDDSVFVRNHRDVSFVLMPGLIGARFKDRELAWQRIIILLGVITACVRRLTEWLAHEGLCFHVLFVVHQTPEETPESAEYTDTRAHALATERGLLELSLREFIDKDLVEVRAVPTLADALELAGTWAEKARADTILMDVEPVVALAPHGVLLGNLCVPGAEPVLGWGAPSRTPGRTPGESASDTRPDTQSDPWDAWVDCTVELLQALL